MKKLLALILGAVAIAGCRSLPESVGGTFDPARPLIAVTAENRLVVNQEPIIVPRRGVDWTITWQLPRDGKARFLKEKGRSTIELLDKLLRPDGNPMRDSRPRKPGSIANSALIGGAGTKHLGCKFRNEYEYECVIQAISVRSNIDGPVFVHDAASNIDGKLVISDPRS